MRERMIELLQDIDHYPEKTCPKYGTGEECGDCQYKLETEKGCDLYARKADYLIAKGLMYPPCKVGDVVYKPIITDDTHEPVIWDITISQISIETGKLLNEAYAVGTICKSNSGESFDFKEIGKTVFLTKEEAEQALKERENNGQNK